MGPGVQECIYACIHLQTTTEHRLWVRPGFEFRPGTLDSPLVSYTIWGRMAASQTSVQSPVKGFARHPCPGLLNKDLRISPWTPEDTVGSLQEAVEENPPSSLDCKGDGCLGPLCGLSSCGREDRPWHLLGLHHEAFRSQAAQLNS